MNILKNNNLMNTLNYSRKPAAVRRAGGYLFLLAGFHLSCRHRTMRAVVCALWVLTTASCAHAAASFTWLYWMPSNPHSFYYNTTGVSGDGSVVVGTGGINPYEGGNLYQAFRWTASSGAVGLGGGNYSFATAVSGDGSIVVGNNNGQAFRWTAGSGMVGLGGGSATAVSGDGSVIVGSSSSASGSQAFRWTAGSGMVGLGYLPGGTYSSANGISADGSVIVGSGSSTSGEQAFRWTAGSGMVGLGYLPGTTNSGAAAVSGDGSVVVGTSYTASGNQAFRWTAGSGMQSLRDVLVTNGLNLDPADVQIASGISADGNTIVGTDYYSTPDFDYELGYVATLPGLIGVSPVLSINSWSSAAHHLVLSWSTNYTGCTLQSSTGLGSTNWTDCASPTVSGAAYVVTNSMSVGAQFFRLKR
jgi:probable HAF family extracellular repeat protein